jgi:vancomycin permeability regulator SanA
MSLRILHLLIVLTIGVLLVLRLSTSLYSSPRTYPIENIPFNQVAIVFGAGLLRDGTPGLVLRDRVETAAQLYLQGKVEILLMSGDNRFVHYDEPTAMKEYALKLGVPSEAIVLDFAGRRTYDTCYRAKEIFGISQAIVITQSFHMPRALYVCSMLGVKATGVTAENRIFRRRDMLYWNLRELFATLRAFWDVHIQKPLPVLGEPEPIITKENK